MVKRLLLGVLILSTGCHRAQMPQSTPPLTSPPSVQSESDSFPNFEGRSTVGNGTDYFNPEHDSAWFLGPRPIRYCLEASADFGIDPANLRMLVESAFEHWRLYIDKKKLNRPVFHPSRKQLPDDPQILMRTTALPTCDGTQDLTLYFGVKDATVKKFLPLYERPIAISERLSYDPKTGWGRGFLWFAKNDDHGLPFLNWGTCLQCLRGVLLHELGHVAGCGHVESTVMSPNLAGLIQVSLGAEGKIRKVWTFAPWIRFLIGVRFSTIDGWSSGGAGTRELFLCEQCGFDRPAEHTRVDRSLYSRFTGSWLKEGQRAKVFLTEKPHFETDYRFTMFAENPGGEPFEYTDFTVRDVQVAATFADLAPVFKQVFWRPGAKNVTTLVSHSWGAVYAGRVRATSGEMISILIKKNTKGETLNIDVLGGETTQRLWHQKKVPVIDRNPYY